MYLGKIQDEVKEWTDRNFPYGEWWQSLLGVGEEVGELNHALLKQHQGIRALDEDLEDEARDAVGDIVIYLMDLCNRRGWDLEKIIALTWDLDKARDWKNNPITAGEDE